LRMHRAMRVAVLVVAILFLSGCDISALIRYPGLISGQFTVASPPGRRMTFSVFAGSQSGQTITVATSVVQVETISGSPFTITDVWEGTYSVFAWEDANSNGTVDPGEWFGRTDGVVVRNGHATAGVVVNTSQYSGQPIQVRR
jgi:hypothetical protein